MLKITLATVGLLAAAFCSSAEAAWHQAKSKHFIIYADENPDKLRDFANRLEMFDAAVRHVRGMQDPQVGDGNRLQVFVTRSDAAVQRLAKDKSGTIRGFYIPRASGSLAFVPRRSGTGEAWDLNAETVFFHEYAHHLMMQHLESPLPEWLVEGFAEFMATVQFEKDGVALGAPPLHRAYGLTEAQSLPLEQLLAGTYNKISPEELESIYGRGWLLTHFLTFEPARKGQLGNYVLQIAGGVSALQAARTAFGDLEQLDRDLEAYLKRRRLKYLKVGQSVLPKAVVEVSRLGPGASAVIPVRMESKRGVNDKTSGPLAERVRAIASKYPKEALVQVTLAEAEFDTGRYDAAEHAADRALALEPRNTEAIIYKGRSILERAADTEGDQSTKFDQARKLFIAANKLDPEDPEPLMLFHQAYSRQGKLPTPNAVEALHYASNLAPQDLGLRMSSAMQYLQDGKLIEARRTLIPIAYNPHGGNLAQVARSVIARVDAGDRQGAQRVAEESGSQDD